MWALGSKLEWRLWIYANFSCSAKWDVTNYSVVCGILLMVMELGASEWWWGALSPCVMLTLLHGRLRLPYVRLVFISGSGFGKKRTPTLCRKYGKNPTTRSCSWDALRILRCHIASWDAWTNPRWGYHLGTLVRLKTTAVSEMSRAIKRRGAPSKDD